MKTLRDTAAHQKTGHISESKSPGTRPEIPDNSSQILRKIMKLRAKIIENQAKMVPKRSQDEARTPKWAQVGPGSHFGLTFNLFWSNFGVVLGYMLELFGDRFSITVLVLILSGFALILDLMFVTFWSPEALAGRKVYFSKTIEFLK